jgi:hypothetical protein
VKPATRSLGLPYDLTDNRIVRQRAVMDRVVDSRNVHHCDSAGAYVEVTDFAITHLARGEPHVRSTRADECVRNMLEEGAHSGRLRKAYSIVLALLAFAESVENDEDKRSRAGVGCRHVTGTIAP